MRCRLFPVFDALVYPGKPDSASLGLSSIHIIDRNTDGTTPPNEASVRQQIATISQTDPYPVIVFDIEVKQYPFDIRFSTQALVNATIKYCTQLINWTKSANPNAKVGFYGVAPVQDYWTTNLYNSALSRADPIWVAQLAGYQKNFLAWQNASAYMTPLIAQVDYLFPVFYTFYDIYESAPNGPNYHGWKDAALLAIAEARKYNKPIYPFIWPQFHPGGAHKDYSYIPVDYWAKQLKFALRNADGVVLWGSGGFLHETWNDTAPWWQAVTSI